MYKNLVDYLNNGSFVSPYLFSKRLIDLKNMLANKNLVLQGIVVSPCVWRKLVDAKFVHNFSKKKAIILKNMPTTQTIKFINEKTTIGLFGGLLIAKGDIEGIVIMDDQFCIKK